MNSLWEKFLENGRVKECPVYDMHAHMGSFNRIYLPFGDFNPEITKSRLERAGIKMLIFCSHWTLFSPDIGNRANIEVVRQLPDKLRAYCGLNPNYPEIIEKDVEDFEKYRDVFVGFKLLSDYHQKPVSHENYSPAWKYADKKGLIVLLHTWGGSQFDGPEQVRIVAEKYPGAKILMGHSCHGAWDETIQLMKDFPNVYAELCAVVDDRGGLEQIMDACGSKQIVFGTDWPWFNHHYYIGAVIDSGISDQDAHNIFHRNAEKLLEGLI
ncbi:MAG: amidohydrolase family protein [Candidatus Omnitrophica bacterium]|nr:amidohydrolase family protein [Candidatus Omnitrophota bacterium]MCM8824788.1 amidohydrolase family protein [Candidatus Omnitrophota bacterium]